MADLEAFDWSNPHRSEKKMNFARNLHERIGFCISEIYWLLIGGLNRYKYPVVVRK